MSREILFHGKRKDNGEWIEGFLVKIGKERFSDPERYGICNGAIPMGGSGICYSLKIYEVIPETVGEYTGLPDKNRKKIFEGDIVRITTGIKGYKSTYHSVIQKVKYYADGCGIVLFYPFNNSDIVEVEVIGNMHDNPELIEVEKC